MALSFSAFIAWSLTRCQPDQYIDTFKQVGSKDLHLPLDGVHLKTMSENPGTGCASTRGARKTTLLSEVFARQCCWRHEKDIFEGTETWKTPPTHPPTHSPVKQENAPWFRRLEGYSTLHMNHIINWHFSAQPGFISLSIAPHMLSTRNRQSSISCPPMKATSRQGKI